jgi:hypothetical protein
MHPATRLAFALPLLLAARLPAQTSCGAWTEVPVPMDPGWNRAYFADVAALPNGDTWAVGSAQLPSPPFGPEDVTLAMRWDGSSWTHTPTPYTAPFNGGANDYLHAVAALAPDDVWAAGERHGDAGGLSVGAWLLVEHWDGSTWEVVDVPDPPGGAGINFSGPRIYDIAALAPDDIWFAGMWAEPNAQFAVTWRPLAMHWDGSGMTIYPTPVLFSGGNSVHLRQVSALAPDDIWGICRTNTASGLTVNPLVLHWDGGDWSQVTMPNLGASHVLDDIVAVASDDVWILAHWYYPSAPFALHWDGSGWTQVAAPYATTAAGLGPGQLYLGTDVINLFDGDSSAVVETFPSANFPSVLSLEPNGGCVLWAVGRIFGENGDLAPFAARMDPAGTSPWTLLGGGLAGAGGVPLLTGDGTLAAGDAVALQLSGAAPAAPASLVVGLSALNAPFKGGVLVPAPDALLSGLVTDALGGWLLAGTWPAGVPSGTSAWFQAWVTDAAGPTGLAASGGLLATTP